MKRILAVLLASLAVLSLAACGGQADSGKQPAAADVVAAVAGGLELKDQMVTADETVFYGLYSSLDREKVADASMYMSGTRSTAVIKAKDEADVQHVKDAIDVRIEDQKFSYEDYKPEEMTKINGALVLTHGNYVLLVMADDTSGVDKAFEAQF